MDVDEQRVKMGDTSSIEINGFRMAYVIAELAKKQE
jgi:hypothetical protein